jgi:hypothetical protein
LIYCNTYEEKNDNLIEIKNSEVIPGNNIEFIVQNMISCNRVCGHRNIFINNKFDENINVGEDTELWARVLKEFPLMYNDKFTVVLTHHSDRTVHIANEKTFIAHIETMKKIFKNDTNKSISSKIRKLVLSIAYFNLARHYEYSNKKMKLFISMMYSIILNPSHRLKEKIYIIVKGILNSRINRD